MNLISALLLLALAAAPLALLGAWFAGRRDVRSGTLVPVGGSDSWWRDAMPWPTGVQEDDEVHWNFGPPERPDSHVDALTVDPVRLTPGLRRHHARDR
jgi:hypothetical protein